MAGGIMMEERGELARAPDGEFQQWEFLFEESFKLRQRWRFQVGMEGVRQVGIPAATGIVDAALAGPLVEVAVDGVFEQDAVERVAVVEVEDTEIELADGLLRSKLDLLFPREADDVGRLLAPCFLEENGFLEAGDLSLGELGELVVRVLEELGE
jgi:hypothetical protein